MRIIYEASFVRTGWWDTGGVMLPSWFDDDLATDDPQGQPDELIDILDHVFMHVDEDTFFHGLDDGPLPLPPDENGIPRPTLPTPQNTPVIVVEVYHKKVFDDVDTIFAPVSVRALDAPDQMLKNEVRRIR